MKQYRVSGSDSSLVVIKHHAWVTAEVGHYETGGGRTQVDSSDEQEAADRISVHMTDS